MSWLLKKDFTKTKKRCPFCGTELNIKGTKQYQDLFEHVSDPNGIPSYKNYYQCDCDDAKHGFWGENGSVYGMINDNFKYIFKPGYYDYKSCLKGSWQRSYFKREYFRENFKYGLMIKKYNNIRYKIHIYLDNIKCKKRLNAFCDIVNKSAISKYPKDSLNWDFDLSKEYMESIYDKLSSNCVYSKNLLVVAVGDSAFPSRSYLLSDGVKLYVVKQYGIRFEGDDKRQ